MESIKIIISDDKPHTPHQLRPDLRDRNPQVRPSALARMEGKMEPPLVVSPPHSAHRTCPDRPWGPPSLLYNGYRVFPGGRKRPGRDADHSPPSSAEV
jgi:hypothetical protein